MLENILLQRLSDRLVDIGCMALISFVLLQPLTRLVS